MQFKDYYEVLGVPAGAATDVIKSSYRRLARKYHPDVSKESDAEDRFKAVNEAYEVLKDPKKRQAYDELRAGGYRPGEDFRPPPNWGQDHGFENGGGDAAGFSDFFESLFGGRGPRATRPGPGPRRPREMRARLEIAPELAYSGGSERVQIGAKTLEIRIPAGILPGQHIRLAGQADGGGDLLLEIGYRRDARFEFEGRDVTARVAIAPWEAALGATVPVPTLGGTVELKVPPGTKTGRRLRLKGRGMPGAPPGDQYVSLEIQTAPADDADASAFYEQMREKFADWDPRAGS